MQAVSLQDNLGGEKLFLLAANLQVVHRYQNTPKFMALEDKASNHEQDPGSDSGLVFDANPGIFARHSFPEQEPRGPHEAHSLYCPVVFLLRTDRVRAAL
jgi:hypothetical protein